MSAVTAKMPSIFTKTSTFITNLLIHLSKLPICPPFSKPSKPPPAPQPPPAMISSPTPPFPHSPTIQTLITAINTSPPSSTLPPTDLLLKNLAIPYIKGTLPFSLSHFLQEILNHRRRLQLSVFMFAKDAVNMKFLSVKFLQDPWRIDFTEVDKFPEAVVKNFELLGRLFPGLVEMEKFVYTGRWPNQGEEGETGTSYETTFTTPRYWLAWMISISRAPILGNVTDMMTIAKQMNWRTATREEADRVRFDGGFLRFDGGSLRYWQVGRWNGRDGDVVKRTGMDVFDRVLPLTVEEWTRLEGRGEEAMRVLVL
ncbi:hypothetical protein ABW19_dt0209907 [Dactylella cylindrospora]|nr:hypothetical protein ABW19_dt0209907 [Dactylella cylindrospora]